MNEKQKAIEVIESYKFVNDNYKYCDNLNEKTVEYLKNKHPKVFKEIEPDDIIDYRLEINEGCYLLEKYPDYDPEYLKSSFFQEIYYFDIKKKVV